MKKVLSILLMMSIILFVGCAKMNTSSKEYTDVTVTVFEAGKADAILIQGDDCTIMIDTGLDEKADTLIDELKENGVSKIDAIFLTHFDKDHVGGADRILSAFDVEHVYTTYLTKESTDIDQLTSVLDEQNKQMEVLNADQTFTYGDLQLDVYAASNTYSNNISNNSSLIIYMSYGMNSILFTGDAQNDRIKDFLDQTDLTVDILKVPYHGHYQKKLIKLVEAVLPDVCLITNSDTEPEEEDIEKTRDVFTDYDCLIYETKDGIIRINMNENAYEVVQ